MDRRTGNIILVIIGCLAALVWFAGGIAGLAITWEQLIAVYGVIWLLGKL